MKMYEIQIKNSIKNQEIYGNHNEIYEIRVYQGLAF